MTAGSKPVGAARISATGESRGAREAWDAAYGASPLGDVPFKTMSGVPVEPLYGDPGPAGFSLAGYPRASGTMRSLVDDQARQKQSNPVARHSPIDSFGNRLKGAPAERGGGRPETATWLGAGWSIVT